MAASKSKKIQAEIDKVKAKISEQQARLKELEQKHREAENEEIVDIVRGMSVSLEELPLVLQRLRDGGTSGQSVQKSVSLRCFPGRGISFRTVIRFSRCCPSMNYPKSTPK